MKTLVTVVLLLGLALPFSPASIAQTDKTHTHKDMQGKTVESPYITYSEFENISVDGKTRVGDLLAVESIDVAIELLGDPKATNVVEIGTERVKEATTLTYEGMEVTFLEAAGKVRLEKLIITGSNRFVRIGDRKVHPGLNASSLSATVYDDYKKSVEESSSPSTYIKVSEEEAGSKGEMSFLEYTDVEIKVDEDTGRVSRFRIFRVI